MSNYSVYNQIGEPLYTFSTNTYTSPQIQANAVYSAAQSGRSFLLSTTSVSVAGGNNLLFQLANPAGSGLTLYISTLYGGTSAASTLNVLSGGTVSGGTNVSLTPVNSNLGTATASVATSLRNITGTLSGGTTLISQYMAAGTFVLEFGGSLIVPPNQTLSMSLGTGALTGGLNLSWWEA